MPQNKLLTEVSIIRPLIIFLLVVYHSLCLYTGGWKPPQGVEPNAAYWWLGHLISGFRIETIAFVGGYVFSYQCLELGRRQAFLPFAWKKVKRLILPCVVFGTAYYLLYRYNPARSHWDTALWRIFNGEGHLWFLPMLFWCFLLTWLLDQGLHAIRRRRPALFEPAGWALLGLLALFTLVRLQGLRLGLTRVPHFWFYFYAGYWVRHLARQRGKLPSRALIATLAAAYLLLLLVRLQACNLQLPGVPWQCPRALRGWSPTALRLLMLGHTSTGILALYLAALRLCGGIGSQRQPGPRLRWASRVCYGTYVFHMFFMQWLYFYTPLPALTAATPLGAWLLPWGTLAVVLAASLAATWLLLRTRLGRFLIG